MDPSATARAQADQALNEAATALKRTMRVTREALQQVRQAQVNLVGVPVETTAPGGIGHGHTQQDDR